MLLAVGVFVLLAMTAWEVLQTSVSRFVSGEAPKVSGLSFLVMGATVVVNLLVATLESRAGRRLRSQVLQADAAHTRSDVFVSLGVIGSLVASKLGYPQADVLVAIAITGFIAFAAFEIVRRAAGPLVDAAAVPAPSVRAVALAVPGVVGVHKVRSRVRPEGAHP